MSVSVLRPSSILPLASRLFNMEAWPTLLQLLETLKGNLELVRIRKLGGVVDDLDVKERND